MAERDPYRVLGLKAGATTAEMKQAYRSLAKKLHPDSSGKASSGIEFSRVVQAYRALMIEERRKRIITFPASPRKPNARPAGTPTAKAAGTASTGTGGPTGRPAAAGRARPTGAFKGTPQWRSAGTPTGKAAGTAHPGTGVPTGRPADARAYRENGTPRQSGEELFKMGRLLLTSKEPALRAFAARTLGNSGRRTAYAFLRKALLDPEETVVRCAVMAIGKLSILQCAGELAALYAKAGVPVRKDILLCVRSIMARHAALAPRRDGFSAILRIAAKDEDPEIRATAARLLQDGE